MAIANDNLVNVEDYINILLKKCKNSLFLYNITINEKMLNGMIENVIIDIHRDYSVKEWK